MKVILIPVLFLVQQFAFSQGKAWPLYKEPYRPAFHFSPAKNWTNDPNGLVYLDGEYHLFYQYNPYGNHWGHMSWGHAKSGDLVHWKQLPVAIPEGERVMIYSGSCVIDKNNTGGFATSRGQMPMVAIYTGHKTPDSTRPQETWQAQYLAYSLDNGKTWTKYPGSPVLDIQQKDFRDPKVFWHAGSKSWIMVVVLPIEKKVQFYGSPNLKEWHHLSDFGPAGDTSFIWECPDLLEVPIKGQSAKKKWVLLNSVQFGMQYFVGDFDGKKFIAESSGSRIFRPDYGPDFYAAITYNNLPSTMEPILLGWVNSWLYANEIPTRPWKGAMSLPRSLSLEKAGKEWVIIEKPIAALQYQRTDHYQILNCMVNDSASLGRYGEAWEMQVHFIPPGKGKFRIRFAAGDSNYAELVYMTATQELHFDRSHTGNTGFSREFQVHTQYSMPVEMEGGVVGLHIYFDNSIVEVFAQSGKKVLTAQLFPDPGDNKIAFISEGGACKMTQVDWWRLKSAW